MADWLEQLDKRLVSLGRKDRSSDFSDEAIRWAIDLKLTPDEFIDWSDSDSSIVVPDNTYRGWKQAVDAQIHSKFGTHLDSEDFADSSRLREAFSTGVRADQFLDWLDPSPVDTSIAEPASRSASSLDSSVGVRLARALAGNGPILENLSKFKGLVRDLFGDLPRESNLLIHTFEVGIARILEDQRSPLSARVERSRLLICNKLALDASVVEWIIHTWTIALNLS